MNDHPRFPDHMDSEEQLAVADEVDITLAGYPSKRSLEVAITAYAEQLDGFSECDIRAGFRTARARAVQFAPTPTQVHDAVGAACIARRARLMPPAPEPLPINTEIPETARRTWREALGGAPPKPKPVVFENGQPIQPKAVGVGDILNTLGVKSE